MARHRAPSDIERATLKKSTVSTAPPWALNESLSWSGLLEEQYEVRANHTKSGSSSTSLAESHSTRAPSKASLPRSPSPTGSTAASSWSVFATMSNTSTVSERLLAKSSSASGRPTNLETTNPAAEPLLSDVNHSHHPRYPQKLQDIFRTNKVDANHSPCTCNCPHHESPAHFRLSRNGMSVRSKKRSQKYSLELARGYPTGQCISSRDLPPVTMWDERDDDDLLLQARRQSVGTNTAINIEAVKMFLNSPLFSNILKSLTVMAAVSLFVIALDATVILHRDLTPEQIATPLSNANASLIITIILSILTVAYSCFTIFLESRRPPEGLDTSNSKPLIVIFSEIVASIIWAQVLSVTIYVYTWTFGCTTAGKTQLSWLWNQEGVSLADHDHIVGRLCRREGAMVGLELLLVMLLIFNFYTHLAQNFRFIRAVS